MKTRKIVLTLIALVLCVGVMFSLSSCMDEEDYYTKNNVDTLVEQLKSKLNEESEKNADEIQNADASNEARIAALEAQVSGLLNTPKYTVTFDVNGADESISTQMVEEGKKVTRPAEPTREDYVFLGWYVGDEKWSFVGDTVTDNITLTAKWVSAKILSVADNCVLDGQVLTIFTNYPRDYVNVKDKITYDSSCKLSLYKNSNLTEEYSYARMTGIVPGENKAYLIIEYDDSEYEIYDVVVYAIESIEFISEGELFASVSVNADLTVNAPTNIPESKLPGYEFAYWAVGGEQVSFPYRVLPSTEFAAVYVPKTYTINYNANDGVMPDSYTVEYTVESGATLPTPTRSLYLFDGWYETSDFSSERLYGLSVGEYGDKTLYAKWISATGGVTYSLSNDGSYYTVTGYEGTSTEIVIPDTLDGIPVTKIASNAFKDKQRITSITVADSVIEIGSSAFSGCISLTTLNLGKGIKSIPSSMAYSCNKLTSVTIGDSVTSIGSNAFDGCTSLMSVTIPDSVTSIGWFAFDGCTSLTSVTIGDSVTSIGSGAFYDCDSLTSVYITDIAAWCNISGLSYYGSRNKKLYLNGELVTDLVIPDSVTSIGSSAFYGCKGLTSVTIPDSVTSIGYEAFRGCTSLTSVTIPDSVTSIGNYAFYGCKGLTSVTIPDSVTSIGIYAFAYCTSLTSIKYSGSQQQWNAIIKGSSWDEGAGLYTITCNYTKD